jgi:diacylglycerol kinase (ATP)
MRAYMIYNPTAGPRDVQQELKRVCTVLRRRGWSVEMLVTEKPGDAQTMACSAAQSGSCDVVIAAGGDGTVNEVVNGLVGTPTALGVLPVGTGNLWAKQLGIPTHTVLHPLRLRDAALGLTRSVVRVIDVGKAGNRYFLCWAGIGLDARVTQELEPRPRHTKRLGALPYVVAAVIVAYDFQGVRARVRVDGRVVRGRILLALASNIQQYGGWFDIAQVARVDDGLLDVFVFKGLGFSYAVRHLLKILSHRHLQDPRVVHRQAREIEVWTEPRVPIQVDGDPAGFTPVRIKVVPKSLRVLIPPSAPADLFV